MIGIEALSYLIKSEVRWGFWSGCQVVGRVGEGFLISPLLFANNTFVFCKVLQD